jgi:hypothetical protein
VGLFLALLMLVLLVHHLLHCPLQNAEVVSRLVVHSFAHSALNFNLLLFDVFGPIGDLQGVVTHCWVSAVDLRLFNESDFIEHSQNLL